MSFSHLHKVIAYLISGLGLVALSLGYELSQPVKMAMVVGYFTSYFVEGSLIARPGYSRAWTTSIVILLIIQVARGILIEPTLSLALEFAAALQISRLFNRRSAQDYQQIAVLAFLHLIAATILSTDLTYALIFIGFVIATPWMLALSHLRREIEANYASTALDDSPQRKAALSRVLASKRVVGAGYLAGTAFLSLPLFVMTLAIFVVMPRVGQGFLSFGRHRGDSVAGFGDQVSLGGFGVIRDDPSVVLRVTPVPKIDSRARRLALRLRGTSFDNYDGHKWTRSDRRAQPLMASAGGEFVLRRPPRPGDTHLRIVLDDLDQPVIFLPHGTVAIHVDPRIVAAIPMPRRLTIAAGHDLRYAEDESEGLFYDAYVTHDPKELSITPLVAEDIDTYLQIPAGHERVAKLARKLTRRAHTAVEKATILRKYLQSAEFAYTLEQPRVGQGRWPLEVFLFEARRGHCEYFSTAMAIMLRTLGIPSRNVTGFVGGRYNSYGEYYALRQGDAHSWVEAYVEDQGWITFDPTPLASAELAHDDGPWSDLYAIADAVRMRWVTQVVGYDLRTQVGILRDLAHWFSFGPRSASGLRSQEHTMGAHMKAVLAWLLFGVLFVAMLTALWWWRRRHWGRAGAISEEQERAVRIYRSMERALDAKGRARPVHRTPLDHACQLRKEGFVAADLVERVTKAYVQARFDEHTLSALQLRELEQSVERIAKVAVSPAAQPRAGESR